ncbi:MAG: saccharopine dehydrogenase C-terminal domain-containing protein [Phycisphaerales bacterium]
MIVPREVTAALLFPKWSYDDDETDLTVMRVVGEGRVRAGRDRPRCRLTWDLFDLRDAVTGFTSMARTTAFPCTIVARLLARRAPAPAPASCRPEPSRRPPASPTR